MTKKLEVIQKIVRLQNMIDKEWNIISVDNSKMIVYGYENLKKLAKSWSKIVSVEPRDDSEYPYRAYFRKSGFEVVALLSEEEYKKATATTAADES